MCLASQNNHPTSLASSWDISFFKSLWQQDPKGSNKVAYLYILDVYVSPNRKYANLFLIYYILDFGFFMSQDDAYFHIHQNDPIDADTTFENEGGHSVVKKWGKWSFSGGSQTYEFISNTNINILANYWHQRGPFVTKGAFCGFCKI